MRKPIRIETNWGGASYVIHPIQFKGFTRWIGLCYPAGFIFGVDRAQREVFSLCALPPMTNAIADVKSASNREHRLAMMLLYTIHGDAAIRNAIKGRKNTQYLQSILDLIMEVPGGEDLIKSRLEAMKSRKVRP